MHSTSDGTTGALTFPSQGRRSDLQIKASRVVRTSASADAAMSARRGHGIDGRTDIVVGGEGRGAPDAEPSATTIHRVPAHRAAAASAAFASEPEGRSEERRVGKECRL